jgi:hypothetical protein
MKEKAALLCILLFLISPFSATVHQHVDMLFGQSAYLTAVVFTITMPMMFCYLLKDNFYSINIKSISFLKRYLVFFIIFIFVTFFSVTAYVYSVIPMISAVIIMFIRSNGNKPVDFKTIEFKSMKLKILLMVPPILFSFLLNRVFVPENTTRLPSVFMGWGALKENVVNILSYISFSFFDVRPGHSIFSVDGIMNVIKLAFGVCLVYIFPIKLVLKMKEQNQYMQHYILCSIVYIATNYFLVFFVIGTSEVGSMRYFIVSSVLSIILSGYYIKKYYLDNKNFSHLIMIVAIVVLTIIHVTPRFAALDNYNTKKEEVHALTEFLKNENLKHGYASYWVSCYHMVMSNFDVEIGSVDFTTDKIAPHAHVTASTYCDPQYYIGETFILMLNDEIKLYPNALNIYGSPTRVLEFGIAKIFVYDYNVAINNFGGEI